MVVHFLFFRPLNITPHDVSFSTDRQTHLNIISCFYRGNKTRAGFLGEENVKLVSSTHTLSHFNNYIYFLLQTQELMKCWTSPHSLSCVIRTWWTLHYSLLVRSWIKLTLVTDESSRHEDNMCDCGLALRCENKTSIDDWTTALYGTPLNSSPSQTNHCSFAYTT